MSYATKPRAVRDTATGLWLAKPVAVWRTPGEVVEWTADVTQAARFKPSPAETQKNCLGWHHQVRAKVCVLPD